VSRSGSTQKNGRQPILDPPSKITCGLINSCRQAWHSTNSSYLFLRGTVRFNSLEQKFIRLGLDPAALGNEVDTSAQMLIRSLRERGITAETFLNGDSSGPAPFDYGGVVMPFGKHKGVKLRDVPHDYLLWVVENIDKRPLLVKQVSEFLKQQYGL
jgi:Putative quorum-sensing-regulated virulence factor